MADLSDYSATYETHGVPTSAADLIGQNIYVSQKIAYWHSKMHQRTGDEIMFVSDYPDFYLPLTLNLEANTTMKKISSG